MNNNFKIYPLHKTAYKYFEERLSEKLTLTVHLKNAINLEEGNIVTFAPSSIVLDDLVIFNKGFTQPPLAPKTVQVLDNTIVNTWLVKEIRTFLSLSHNNVCILEDYDDNSTAGVITRFSFKNFRSKKGELYYILDSSDSDESILEAIKENSSYWPLGMGICTTIENISSHFSKDYVLNDSFFEIAAKNTQKIYVQAYDSEGYLVWNKRDH